MTKQQAARWYDVLLKQIIPPLLVAILSWSSSQIGTMREDINQIKVDLATVKAKVDSHISQGNK